MTGRAPRPPEDPFASPDLIAGAPPFSAASQPAPRRAPERDPRARPPRARDPLSESPVSEGAFSEGPLKALRPWAAVFAETPPADLRVIGALMASLSPLIELAGERLRDGRAELDSFDDLIAEGPLERLIASEFLWMSLAPQEFARRIAEREALRRRPRYQDPAEDRAIAVIVDCGPEMLGRPRLAALASLLCLGASAARRGLKFLWRSTAFAQEPFWVEGLSRRDLARFAHQTTYRGFGPERVAEALETAPLGVEERLLWIVSAAEAEMAAQSAAIPFPTPASLSPSASLSPPASASLQASPPVSPSPPASISEHRIIIRETWPDRPGAERARLAEAVVTGPGGFRRAATIAFPEETACAALLRAPFRVAAPAPSGHGGASWAPPHLCRGADGTGLCWRNGRALAFRFGRLGGLRVRLPDGAALLGLRARQDNVAEIVTAADGVLSLARVSGRGTVETSAIQLAAEHPLIAERHPPEACPPLLRLGRSARVALASPEGALYALRAARWDGLGGLCVEPAPQLLNHRFLGRSGAWILCVGARAPNLVAAHARHGRRVTFEDDPDQSLEAPISGFAFISEQAGALVRGAGGWRWLRPIGAGPAEPPPPEMSDGLLVSVSCGAAPGAAGGAGSPSSSLSSSPPPPAWSALFWTPETALRRASFHRGAWRVARSHAPKLTGALRAILSIGPDFFAAETGWRAEAERGGAQAEAEAEEGALEGALRLIEFTGGASPQMRLAAEERWWREAPVVEL
ncbi:MAG: hypothetical protein AAGM38_04565 [Pseudomonadota bacterium]